MKTMIKSFLSFVTMMVVFAVGGHAQGGDAALKAQLISDWERAKVYTKEYLDALPENGVGFKPTTEIRSFAEQMLHLTQANIGFTSNATGLKSEEYSGKNLEKIEAYKASKAALTKVVLDGYDFAIAGAKALDPAKLSETTKMGTFEFSRYMWLVKAFEHQTHHRGQCTIYLRLMGTTPPAEKLF